MEKLEVGLLFILGVGVFGGTLGAWLFQRIRVPQVVGYIVIGLLLGQSGLHLVTREGIAALQPLNLFALGVIGFLVGSELRWETFRKHWKHFSAILFGEGMGAFVLVGVPVAVLLYLMVGSLRAAVAGGVVFGAIASATDPASTMEVLREYRSRGSVTTALIAIIALDDALAMTLYGCGTATAEILTGGSASLLHAVTRTVAELAGAVLLGVAVGLLLTLILRWLHQQEKALPVLIGTLLLAVGVAYVGNMDVILTTMTAGVVLTNLLPRRRGRELLSVIHSFAAPVYVIFFVLVGARLSIANMPGWLWGVVLIYVLGRTVGKMTGAWWGAKVSGTDPAVRRYAGLGLFAQGGVAVGLSIMAGHHLGDLHLTEQLFLGDAVILGVTATTLIVQIIGPSMVKLAVGRAGEIGRNVTDQDVIASWSVRNVMSADVNPIETTTPLSRVIDEFTHGSFLVYPVVARNGRVAGLLSLEEIKNVLASRDMWEWVVAADVMIPVGHTITSNMPLQQAMDLLDDLRLEQVPVVDDEQGRVPVGVLDLRQVRRAVTEEVLKRQSEPHAST